MSKAYTPAKGRPTLADARRVVRHIEISCRRCGRHGKYPVERAIVRWGAEFLVWDVVEEVSADCPRKGETGAYETCQVWCPTLLEMDRKG